ncbi:hypothetical protein ACFL1Z_04050 [Thermodesulfobacteriota bacterium]
MRKLNLIFVLLLFPVIAGAKDLSTLYSQDTLSYWQTRYPKNIQHNFLNVIMPILNSNEKNILSSTKLVFPLIGEHGGDPLEFYSYFDQSGPKVAMPILSIKFFDDLAIAYAWLWVNRYSIETVSDYVATLKYNDHNKFHLSKYPQPLDALNIPRNALENSDVDDLSQKILKSAMIWILNHELGHIYHRHPGYGPDVSAEQAQKNEEQADRFATELMRRIGVAPIGMANFFTVASHWWSNRGDFTSDQAWRYYLENKTHPLTAGRLKMLAQDIQESAKVFVRKEPNYPSALQGVLNASGDISKIAKLLEDTKLQRSIRAKAMCITELGLSLAPRYPHEIWPIGYQKCIAREMNK